jgi:hypothetical protein
MSKVASLRKVTKAELPAMTVLDVKGFQFAKIGTLASWLDVSTEVVRDLLCRLQASHQIQVVELSERLHVVNVRDFWHALLSCVPTRQGWAK